MSNYCANLTQRAASLSTFRRISSGVGDATSKAIPANRSRTSSSCSLRGRLCLDQWLLRTFYWRPLWWIQAIRPRPRRIQRRTVWIHTNQKCECVYALKALVWYRGELDIDLLSPSRIKLIQHVKPSGVCTPPTRPEHAKRQVYGRSATGQSNSSVKRWTLHEKYAKYTITKFIKHQSFIAFNPHKASIVWLNCFLLIRGSVDKT